MFHDVFNLILENLSLPTPPVALSLCRLVCKINPIHSAHDSLIDRFRLRSFSIAVLLIHIDKITEKKVNLLAGVSQGYKVIKATGG